MCRRRKVAWWLVLLVFAFGARESFASKARLVPIHMTIAERGEVKGYMLLTESNELSFLPPHEWKQQARLDRCEVIFLSPDLTSSLTLQLIDGHVTNGWSWEAVRGTLAQRFPNGRIKDELECYACDVIGRAYDIEETGGAGGKMVTRIATVPCQSATLEIRLTAPKSRFPLLNNSYGVFMASLRLKRAVESP